MQNATYIAGSRLMAQQTAMDLIANNLANATTIGFKAQRPSFAQHLDAQAGAETISGGRTLAFVATDTPWRETREGALNVTGNPLDLALNGEGYFTVETPRGPRLTRAGRFMPGGDGNMTDADGNALLDRQGRKIALSANDGLLTVKGDGTIMSENGMIGQIGIVVPRDPNALREEGTHLLAATGPTDAAKAPRLTQGALEESNTQQVVEITRMISGMREFQFVSQMVQTDSDRQMAAIDKILGNR